MPEPTDPILDDEAAGRIVDAMAPMLGIAIDPAWRAAVVANLQATTRAAALVLAFPLDDELEPAPVFRA
ncbi:MAG: DUF4089 domain-containing protein [Methylobacteriaceae bacterium]|nr:DUF4089 domain-containing protein [Methylobacteriaceae bacterium]